MKKPWLIINERDNVAVALRAIKAGETADAVTASEAVPCGHKIALRKIEKNQQVFKYGFPIGRATETIEKGGWVHTQNLSSEIAEKSECSFCGFHTEKSERAERFFDGYLRADGSVGTRNEIYIIPTVGCANSAAQKLAAIGNAKYAKNCDGFFAFTHSYGCSQLGSDAELTAKALAAFAMHPNAGGVLLLSLGCENNNLEHMAPYLENCDRTRVKTLVMQSCADEIAQGEALLAQLAEQAAGCVRTRQPLSKLRVGVKCGGSDAFSGVTANPLCGRVTDLLCAAGGSVLMTEVPEMFGAEQLLFSRFADSAVLGSAVKMINDFKAYYINRGLPVGENPSPGNREGGITTLEEKSLGCVAKGGNAPVSAVLDMYSRSEKPGLSLLNAPGNDLVSATALAASGATLVLFTTGRGTPLCAPVPTIKISSNSALSERKPGWIDFDAGTLLSATAFSAPADELLEKVLRVASGEPTRGEVNGSREFAIFKDGVTL